MAAVYVPIRVSTLRGDLAITFDAYVRVAGKYILFCKEGDSFEGNRLDRLRSKKVQTMYVAADDEPKYRAYVQKNLQLAYSASSNKSAAARAEIIQGQLQSVSESLIDALGDESMYKFALQTAEEFKTYFTGHTDLLAPFLGFKNTDKNISQHGVSVAVLALAIANEMQPQIQEPLPLEAMVVGCLIHDLDHAFNNLNLNRKPIDMTEAELAIQASHSVNGLARLKEYPFYHPAILDIVGLHEEKIDGSGIQGKKEKELNPVVMIAATANAFDQYLQSGTMDIKDALKQILIDKMGVLPLKTLKALQDAMKKRGII